MTREEIIKHYENVRNIVNQVRISWHLFDQLFRSGEENLELLRRSAGWVFLTYYNSIYISVLLRICTLTDPSKSQNKYDNLSFKQLAEQIKKLDLTEGQTILNLIENQQSHFADLRTLRDKAIAHNDLETFGTHTGPRDKIDEAIGAILSILDCFETYLKPSQKRWQHLPHFPPGNDGNALLSILRHRENLIAERTSRSITSELMNPK